MKRMVGILLLSVTLLLSACGLVETAVSVANMTTTVSELNEVVGQGAAVDVAEARTLVEQLQTEWSSISADVLQQSEPLHNQVQAALDKLTEAVSAEQLDKLVMDAAIQQLQEGLLGIAEF